MPVDNSNQLPSVILESASTGGEGNYQDINRIWQRFGRLSWTPQPANVQVIDRIAQMHFGPSVEGESYILRERGICLPSTLSPAELGLDPAAGAKDYNGKLIIAATADPDSSATSTLQVQFYSEERDPDPEYPYPIASACLTISATPLGERWLEFEVTHPEGNMYYDSRKQKDGPSPRQAAAARAFQGWAYAQELAAYEPQGPLTATETQPSPEQAHPNANQNPFARFLGNAAALFTRR